LLSTQKHPRFICALLKAYIPVVESVVLELRSGKFLKKPAHTETISESP
jgi:hypothetical protein